MVDQSRILVAAWNGTKDGTGNCVRYVRQSGKTLFTLKPHYDFELEVWFGIND
ncbi:hypothetical protein J2Z69_000720 [Paenibacillus shirakamiensis]|uniref:Uncharacterized protein n=1 Tax=Paenibacillus shirakamiensis TaxID=1265935 RepID=A0ABS4JDB1_9BACL|nr:hypothetical protein [Paenibacillus shirakamiensis]MBP1999701.1 hypothetical protein [Paenibacillus shirakamiensis]